MVKVVDVHTHMYSPSWVSQVRAARDPDFQLGEGAQDGALIFRIADMEGVLQRVDALPPETRDAVRSGNALKLFDL